jgi:hypothetical protein
MEKISSILPGNPRVHSVDLDEAPPARPGAPTFGRKAGRNTVSDRVTLSQKAKELAAQDTMMVKNPKEASRAKKVEELNRRFFETRLQKPEPAAQPASQEIAETLNEAASQDLGNLRGTYLPYEEPEVTAPSSANRLSIEA